jgi:hypothetical protein
MAADVSLLPIWDVRMLNDYTALPKRYSGFQTWMGNFEAWPTIREVMEIHIERTRRCCTLLLLWTQESHLWGYSGWWIKFELLIQFWRNQNSEWWSFWSSQNMADLFFNSIWPMLLKCSVTKISRNYLSINAFARQVLWSFPQPIFA